MTDPYLQINLSQLTQAIATNNTTLAYYIRKKLSKSGYKLVTKQLRMEL